MSDYCDGWCDRCRLRWRCEVFLSQRRYLVALRAGDDEFARHMDELLDVDDWNPALPPELADAWAELRLGAGGLEPAEPRAVERFHRQLAQHGVRADAHPLSRRAREYAELTRGALGGLDQFLEREGTPGLPADESTRHAVETLSRLAPTIAAKTRRAVGFLVTGHPAGDSPAPGPVDEVQSDANGCAKLARLSIRESQDAWQTLKDAPRPIANGVPAAMLTQLGVLDDQIGLTFPQAMAFVRPGFDDAPLPV